MLGSSRRGESTGRALGIDIGSHAIKCVLLEETPEGVAIRHAERLATPAGAVRDGVVHGRREVAASIRQAVKRCGCRILAASAAVPADQSVVRWIDLPMMDRDSLAAATRFEARKYLPWPVDQAAVQIVPMEHGAGPGEDRMRALLVAAPRVVVNSRAEALEAAGLDVASVEIEPVAVLRAIGPSTVRYGSIWRGQPLACVMLGEVSSGMCVVQDTSVRFVRAISWGSARLASALAEAAGCDAQQASGLKEAPDAELTDDGVLTWTEDGEERTSAALVPELERLCREIQRLLNYYRSLFPERSYEGILDRVVLTGGPAGLKGIARFFARALQIEVIVRNPLESLATRLSPEGFRAIDGHETSFAACVGLALGELQLGHRVPAAGAARSREFVWRRKAA